MRSVVELNPDQYRGSAAGRAAFTLIELLVTLFVIAILMAILIPALVSARDQTRAFVCLDHMRAAAFEFRLFADPYTCADRGQSARLYGSRFSAVDFQESLYEIDEFWDVPQGVARTEAYRRGQKPILCPSGPSGLVRVRAYLGGPSLTQNGVYPPHKINYAMNRRLYRAPANFPGAPIPVDRFVTIGKRILDHPHVPLLFDADAQRAVDAGKLPFFSAPPGRGDEPSVYDDNAYWFPARRHKQRLSVCFVGGHVASTSDPMADRTWDWDYHPAIPSNP